MEKYSGWGNKRNEYEDFIDVFPIVYDGNHIVILYENSDYFFFFLLLMDLLAFLMFFIMFCDLFGKYVLTMCSNFLWN